MGSLFLSYFSLVCVVWCVYGRDGMGQALGFYDVKNLNFIVCWAASLVLVLLVDRWVGEALMVVIDGSLVWCELPNSSSTRQRHPSSRFGF